MALIPNKLTVGTSRVRLDTASDKAPSRGGTGRVGRTVLLENRGTGSIFIGGSTVTTANGYEWDAGKEAGIDLEPSDELWAVASSSQQVQVLQFGV